MPGKQSFISQLSPDIATELHQRIREANYGQHDSHANWLKSLGFQSSRSAMHRYANRLKKNDGYQGMAGSFALDSVLNDSISQDERLVSLYQSLGELEYKRTQLLEQIRDIVREKIPNR